MLLPGFRPAPGSKVLPPLRAPRRRVHPRARPSPEPQRPLSHIPKESWAWVWGQTGPFQEPFLGRMQRTILGSYWGLGSEIGPITTGVCLFPSRSLPPPPQPRLLQATGLHKPLEPTLGRLTLDIWHPMSIVAQCQEQKQ